MPIPIDNYVLNFRTSCTKEEAVAKMLGWLRGPIRLDPDAINERQVSAEQLPYLHDLVYSLEDHLLILREVAIEKISAAFDNPDSQEEIRNDLLDALVQCDEQIAKAAKYMIGIDDELAKGESSILRIDHSKTESLGELQITLKSLDDWAQQNHQISIINSPDNQAWDKDSLVHRTDHHEKSDDDDGSRSVVAAKHLYTTLAYLLEAFANVPNSGYLKSNNELNISAIAGHLKNLAIDPISKKPLSGQSAEAIKNRIEAAIKIKKDKLSGK